MAGFCAKKHSNTTPFARMSVSFHYFRIALLYRTSPFSDMFPLKTPVFNYTAFEYLLFLYDGALYAKNERDHSLSLSF